MNSLQQRLACRSDTRARTHKIIPRWEIAQLQTNWYLMTMQKINEIGVNGFKMHTIPRSAHAKESNQIEYWIRFLVHISENYCVKSIPRYIKKKKKHGNFIHMHTKKCKYTLCKKKKHPQKKEWKNHICTRIWHTGALK